MEPEIAWLSFLHSTEVAGVTWDEQLRVKTEELTSFKEVIDGIPAVKQSKVKSSSYHYIACWNKYSQYCIAIDFFINSLGFRYIPMYRYSMSPSSLGIPQVYTPS